MEKEIEKLIEENKVIKEFSELSNEELKIIRMYINLGITKIKRNSENEPEITVVKTCINESYNFLDYIVSYRYNIDDLSVSSINLLSYAKGLRLCRFCKCKSCIRRSLAIFLDEIDNYNQNNINKIQYINVIDYLLKRKVPQFNKIPDQSFFKNVNLIDLMYVQVILESDLIFLSKYEKDNNNVEFNYLDITKKENNEYYINKLITFYKNSRNGSSIEIDINKKEEIFNEKDEFLKIYKISAYYKYLIEVEKIDIIIALRELLKAVNVSNKINVRDNYFIYRYFKKVEKLPYSKSTKEKIYNILNYVLNYMFKPVTPYVPINILVYSDNKEGVVTISKIIGEFMWYFTYLSDNMRYYDEYINNIILDKFQIQKLYYDNKGKAKEGILLLHNFENLLYTDPIQKNLTLNILTDEMENNNSRVCTIIYGERHILNQIIGNHHKLSKMLINLELEIDDLDVQKIFELVVEKLEKSIKVSEGVKEKIYNYIKATYKQSDIQNLEYVNKLYNLIILNINKTFSMTKEQKLKLEDVPDAYNTKDLPTVMKDIDSLVGLKEIKSQIHDLVALLKFNKKVNIDIKDFNLHMCFSGNPGTGKTTVGRMITDIFFNLGYIKQNKLTEVTAKDLIAEYLGQTSVKTFNVVKSALGGVLFIDEAYAITSGSGDGAQYGNESIATLLKLMEDYKDKLIIIFAGYKEEMQNFQNANPGLFSRIGYTIDFPDYSLEELTQIYLNLLDANKLKITDEALEKFREIIKISSKYDNFGNARYINTCFQKILIEHSKNVEKENIRKNLYLITEKDIVSDKLIVKDSRNKIGF